MVDYGPSLCGRCSLRRLSSAQVCSCCTPVHWPAGSMRQAPESALTSCRPPFFIHGKRGTTTALPYIDHLPLHYTISATRKPFVARTCTDASCESTRRIMGFVHLIRPRSIRQLGKDIGETNRETNLRYLISQPVSSDKSSQTRVRLPCGNIPEQTPTPAPVSVGLGGGRQIYIASHVPDAHSHSWIPEASFHERSN